MTHLPDDIVEDIILKTSINQKLKSQIEQIDREINTIKEDIEHEESSIDPNDEYIDSLLSDLEESRNLQYIRT